MNSESGDKVCYQACFLGQKIIRGKLVEEWVKIVTKNKAGVPISSECGVLVDYLGYQSYEQAQSLCWWFLAAWESDRLANFDKIFLTRPKVKIKTFNFTYSLEAKYLDDADISIK